MKEYLTKVLYVLSGERKQLAILLAAFVASSLLEAFGISLIGPFLGIVSDTSLATDHPLIGKIIASLGLETDTQIISAVGLFVIGFFCFKSVAYFACKIYVYRFGYKQKRDLESRLVHTYMHIPYLFHLNHNSAALIKNVVIESYQFTINCLIPLLDIIANLIVVVFLFVLLTATDLSLMVVAVSILLPVILFFARLGSRIRGWGKTKSQSQEDIIKIINHGLGGLKETKVIGCERYFEDDIKVYSNNFSQAATMVDAFQILPRVTIEAVLVIFLLTFIIISQLIFGRTLDDLTSVMGVFAVASIRLIPAASQILNSLGRMRESSYALDMLYFDLKEVEKYPERAAQRSLEGHRPTLPYSFDNEVVLNGISYRYPTSTDLAIQDLSITIKKGESVALVGKSGSGKTTLVDIILGLLQPVSGDIQVDGRSVYENLRGWQDLIGYIPQTIFLTDETVKQNIAFGVPVDQIDEERLRSSIAAAQLEELIENLPEGLDTPVGERGVRLSGGQRQRIGIARALYHEREILVLDEATSALDTETEQKVSDAINALAGSKTLIIIAHRYSTIKDCDRIYRMEQGKLQQSGTYEEVIGSSLQPSTN